MSDLFDDEMSPMLAELRRFVENNACTEDAERFLPYIDALAKTPEISLDGRKLIRWVTPTSYERIAYVDELLRQIEARRR